MVIPALLSKKANAPVMMRISREDEHYIGRARTGIAGRAKVGFAKDGRITATEVGSQTTHAMTRANMAGAEDAARKFKAIAHI